MRIAHVIPSLDPATGGPPIVAAALAAAQAALGCQTRLVAYGFPHAQQNVETALRTIPHMAQVTVDYLPPLTRPERFLAHGARRRLVPLLAGADVIHLHGVWDPVVYAAAAVATKLAIGYVLTPHGMLDQWAIAQKPWKKRLALLLGYRGMLQRAMFLHFLNEDERSLAAPLHLAVESQVLPNGIFLEEFDSLPPKGEFRAARPHLVDKPFVLFLGRLHYKKGLDYLADAFAIVARQIPQTQLVVAGPDAGAQRELESQIKGLGIADRVHLIGPIYGREKLRALVDCDCFCLSSRREGFSLAVTEAMACRAPVVISKSCHFPEVQEAGAGTVVDLDPSQIAAAIIAVLADPAKARQMGEAGRQLVLTRFTWPTVARQMIDAYRGAMGVESKDS
ncbi:MAG: glycosyltransferase [Tepidisphaeraceae bacterium]|jgi:glycosyltransferase involved in cell wall biosynthesis